MIIKGYWYLHKYFERSLKKSLPQGYMPGERTGDSGPAKLEAYEKFCWYDGE